MSEVEEEHIYKTLSNANIPFEVLRIEENWIEIGFCIKKPLLERVWELLDAHEHADEIAPMLGISDIEAKKLCRKTYIGWWGFDTPEDWKVVRDASIGKYIIFSNEESPVEWIDEGGNFRCFDTEKEALAHLRKSLKMEEV